MELYGSVVNCFFHVQFVIVLCFVVRYFVSILDLQSSCDGMSLIS